MFGFNFDLKDQLSFYGAYHSTPLNQLVHFFFVPLILWSASVWLAYIPTISLLDFSSHAQFLPAALARFVPHVVTFVLSKQLSLLRHCVRIKLP